MSNTMHRKLMTIAMTAMLAALACVGSYAALPKPLVTVRKLAPGTAASKAVWEQTPSVARFYFSKISQPASQRGEVRLAYGDNNLYAAYKCLDSGRGKKGRITPEGEQVPDADSASFLLDIDNDGKTFCMFTTTAAGKKTTEIGRQFKHDDYKVDWTVETTKSGDTWTALMTIPFKSLGIATPKPGTKWGCQMSRYDPGIKWPIFWANVRKDPRETQRIGEITFGAPAQVVADFDSFQIAVPGSQILPLNVCNPTGKPVTLSVAFSANRRVISWTGTDAVKTLPTQQVTAQPGVSSVPVKFNYPIDGWSNLTITVTGSDGRVLTQSPGIPVRTAAHAAQTTKFVTVVNALSPASPAARSERDQVLSQLKELSDLLPRAYGDADKWKALGPKVIATEKSVNRLRAMCADAKGIGYSVGTESALTKIMRDKLFEGAFGQSAKIELAKNEFESTQVAVIAYDKPLTSVSVSVSDLKSDKGTIPADRIALNLVEFVHTGEPPYEIDYIGWFPDPLMDYAPFDLAAGGIRPVWITVHTPQDVPAGLYEGTVTIKPANAQPSSIPLQVRVWDFALPTTSHQKTALTFDQSQYRRWYGQPMSKEQRRDAYRMLLEHRLSPSNIYSKEPIPAKEDIPFCVELGMNAFNLNFSGGVKNEEVRNQITATIKDYKAFLDEHGWWDMAYIYGFDEPGSNRWPDLRDQFGWMKSQFPDLPRMCTVVPNKELKGYVNRWVPLVANFRPDEAQEYINDGDEVWWYTCCGPERPFPNWFVDYPATDPRILFWMSWKYQVPGFLYWTINRWHSQLTKDNPSLQKLLDAGKRWPELPWNPQTSASFNGDGHLIYPGPKGNLLSSVRLEAVRDGIDDYEYFYTLNDLVKAAEAKPNADKALIARAKELLGVREDVVTSTSEFTTDPSVIYEARRQVAETIEKLAR